MYNYTDNFSDQKSRKSLKTVYSLTTIAVLAGLITLAGLFACIYLISQLQNPSMAMLIAVLSVLLIVGLLAGGLIVSIINLTNKLDRLEEHARSLDQRTAILAEQSVAFAALQNAGVKSGTNQSESHTLMAEVRDILLLPEEERQKRYRQLLETEFQKRKEAAEAYIES
ncbi:MAG: hypothetical protein JSV03_08980, partial [Planctomycetota bacterium]